MKRCADGCKFYSKKWEKNWCNLKKCKIENLGRFCNHFIPDTKWSKFIKWLGF